MDANHQALRAASLQWVQSIYLSSPERLQTAMTNGDLLVVTLVSHHAADELVRRWSQRDLETIIDARLH